MTAIDQSAGRSDTFECANPASGEVIAKYPIHTEEEVRDAVERARAAGAWWRALGFKERKERLLAWKGVIARRAEELIELIQEENGKPRVDAIGIDVVLTLEHLNWAARHAGRVLRRRRYLPNTVAPNQLPMVEYEPLGVVGVIGPWNYPAFTPMGSISYALAAGNAVVFKPSEYTPGVGQWLADTFATAVPDQPVFQVVTGHGETGAALVNSGIDKVAFTGSVATARKVMAACAEHLTPVLIEGGGKDAFIVDADADIDAAAASAVWGGIANGGQTCAGVERIYVAAEIYESFIEKVSSIASHLKPGSDGDADYGPVTMPAQLDLIRRHLTDAFDRGARAVVGGPESVDPPYVHPVVLVDVPDDALIIREETFGPIIPITPVRDVDEAVERANNVHYGLGATVFSRKRGLEIARRLHSGMVSINDFGWYAAHPALPFGGVDQSGFGRIHGADGLREFVRPKAITRQLFPLPKSMQFSTFNRTPKAAEQMLKLTKFIHGRR